MVCDGEAGIREKLEMHQNCIKARAFPFHRKMASKPVISFSHEIVVRNVACGEALIVHHFETTGPVCHLKFLLNLSPCPVAVMGAIFPVYED
jgi:hypothetical protein